LQEVEDIILIPSPYPLPEGEGFFAGFEAKPNLPLAPSFGFAHQSRCGLRFVIPAKAGIQKQRDEHTVWMPAFAGMTVADWSEIELVGRSPSFIRRGIRASCAEVSDRLWPSSVQPGSNRRRRHCSPYRAIVGIAAKEIPANPPAARDIALQKVSVEP